MKKTNILGVNVDCVIMEEAKDIIFGFFNDEKLNIVHTINPEFILESLKDENYKAILNSSSLSVPDAIGVVIASKLNKNKIKSRVAGCDLVEYLFENMENTPHSVYLMGGDDETINLAVNNLRTKYKGLDIAGYRNGYFNDDNDKTIIEDINNSGANLLLVGLGGTKKQEEWVYKYRDLINAKVSIGVGGAIDVFSGKVKRAPKVWQNLGLEWLYRTFQNPRKRLKRVVRLPYFLLIVLVRKVFKINSTYIND